MSKKKGILICVCREATKNCYMLCPKGRKINPDKVFQLKTWRKA